MASEKVLHTITSDVPAPDCTPTSQSIPSTGTHPYHCTLQQSNPDHVLPDGIRAEFHQLLQGYDSVFDRTISGYHGSVGPFKAVVNMGPVQPPQRKSRLQQYSRNKSVELQDKFDELERQGVLAGVEDFGVADRLCQCRPIQQLLKQPYASSPGGS